MRFEEEIKTKEFQDIKQKAYLNVIYTGSWLQDQSIQKLKANGINDQHYNILRILRGKHPDSVCPGEVKEVLLNKRGDLTRLLDKLVRMNLVDRNTNEVNRRMIDLKITNQGLQLIKDLNPVMNELENALSRLSQAEANQLSDLLDKIRS